MTAILWWHFDPGAEGSLTLGWEGFGNNEVVNSMGTFFFAPEQEKFCGEIVHTRQSVAGYLLARHLRRSAAESSKTCYHQVARTAGGLGRCWRVAQFFPG